MSALQLIHYPEIDHWATSKELGISESNSSSLLPVLIEHRKTAHRASGSPEWSTGAPFPWDLIGHLGKENNVVEASSSFAVFTTVETQGKLSLQVLQLGCRSWQNLRQTANGGSGQSTSTPAGSDAFQAASTVQQILLVRQEQSGVICLWGQTTLLTADCFNHKPLGEVW